MCWVPTGGCAAEIEIQEPQNRECRLPPRVVAVRPPAGTDRARLLTLRPPRAAKGTPKGLGCSPGFPREQPNVYTPKGLGFSPSWPGEPPNVYP